MNYKIILKYMVYIANGLTTFFLYPLEEVLKDGFVLTQNHLLTFVPGKI